MGDNRGNEGYSRLSVAPFIGQQKISSETKFSSFPNYRGN